MFWSYGGYGVTGIYTCGNEGGVDREGAVRFRNVTIAKNTTVLSGTLNLRVGLKGSGSGNLKYVLFGIDEDNTGDFGGSNPLTRTPTTAETRAQYTLPPVGEGVAINVASEMNEILARSGWSSGNAMAFKFYNDGSPTDVWFSGGTTGCTLDVLLVTRPNFYPTSTTVNAPDMTVNVKSIGIKIARFNVDVLNSTHKQQTFNTNWPVLKSEQFGNLSVADFNPVEIAHNLGYKGAFLAYFQPTGGVRGKLPSLFSSNVQGYAGMSDTVLTVQSEAGDLYYYIFIDDIEL
jgi:hypothetical protein